jgi:hypothetical protein
MASVCLVKVNVWGLAGDSLNIIVTCLYRRIHTYHAVLLSCHEYAVLTATCQGHGKVAALERHGNGMICVNRPLGSVAL